MFKLGLLTALSMVAAFDFDGAKQYPIVAQANDASGGMVNGVIDHFKNMPLRRRDAPGKLNKEGKPWTKYVPYDLERRYDEATFKVYDRRLKIGARIPKAAMDGTLQCLDTPVMGYMLGFVYGLQYNWRDQGKCFSNFESSIIALDNIYQMLFLVFVPWEWAQLSLAMQDFIDVSSALYINCEGQEAMARLSELLTYEGILGLFTRTLMGLNGEVPFYFEKINKATETCIQGESLAKLVKILMDYTI